MKSPPKIDEIRKRNEEWKRARCTYYKPSVFTRDIDTLLSIIENLEDEAALPGISISLLAEFRLRVYYAERKVEELQAKASEIACMKDATNHSHDLCHAIAESMTHEG
jgi:hypothetical protein